MASLLVCVFEDFDKWHVCLFVYLRILISSKFACLRGWGF